MFGSAMGLLCRGSDHKWLPGVLVGKSGVKLTVKLSDGRTVQRHLDLVRSAEHATMSHPIRGGSNRCAARSDLVPPRRSDTCVPAPVPATAAGALPGGNCCSNVPRTASPVPVREHRYNLRDRSLLAKPNRLTYESSE